LAGCATTDAPRPAAVSSSTVATGCLMVAVYDGFARPDVQSWLKAVSTTPPDLTAPDGTPRDTMDPEVADVLARDAAQRQAAAALLATGGLTEARDNEGRLIAAVHTRPADDGGVVIERLDYWQPGPPCST